jgi:hypothetical protein
MQPSHGSQTEGRISLALSIFSKGQFKSLRAAARSYDILHTTLTKRYRGIPSRHKSQPNSGKLTEIKEEVLLQRILDLNTQGFAPRISIVREIANLILANREASHPQIIGKNWATNLVNRQDSILTIYNRKYGYQRAKCEGPVLIQG